jgi:hypothetical protein
MHPFSDIDPMCSTSLLEGLSVMGLDTIECRTMEATLIVFLIALDAVGVVRLRLRVGFGICGGGIGQFFVLRSFIIFLIAAVDD